MLKTTVGHALKSKPQESFMGHKLGEDLNNFMRHEP
jgi:hypothetical protein